MRSTTIKSNHLFVIFVLVLAVIGLCSVSCAEEAPTYDLDSSQTMMVIPLDNSAVAPAKEFAQQIQASSMVHVSAMVYAPPGIPASLVLSGSPSDLQQALALYQKLTAKGTGGHLIVIAASLRELTSSDRSTVGLRPVPTVSGSSTANWGRSSDSPHIKSNSQSVTGNWTDVAALNDTLGKSKVLVSSEVYTPNGIKAQISNIKSVPIFSADSSGNVQTQYQNLETSISVVPTIIKYSPDKPQESLVRVDVDVKVSIVSDTLTFKNYSAPEYSAKTLSTTRILTADNQSNVIGTFITDSDLKTTSGIPVLGELPLLKYLFSKETKEKVRNTAVLTLSVRLLPMLSAKDQ